MNKMVKVMKNLKNFVVASLMPLLLISGAKANEMFKPYVGIDYSRNRVKNIETRDLFGLTIGNTFNFDNIYVAPEFRVNLAKNIYKYDNNNEKVKSRARDKFSIALNLGYNFNEKFSAFVGLSGSQVEISYIDWEGLTENENVKDFILGYIAGVKYNLCDKMSVIAKYEFKRFDKSDYKYDNNQYTLGVNYNF